MNFLKKLQNKATARAAAWSARGVISKQQERTIRKEIKNDYMAGVHDTMAAMKEICLPALLEYAKIENDACYPWETTVPPEHRIERDIYKAKKALKALGLPLKEEPQVELVEIPVETI